MSFYFKYKFYLFIIIVINSRIVNNKYIDLNVKIILYLYFFLNTLILYYSYLIIIYFNINLF